MSFSSAHNQLLLNDGTGKTVPVSTGTWVTQAINMEEKRRVSFTIGITSATGAAGDIGGFTGTLLVQGTNELSYSYGSTGTPQAFSASPQPGLNGYTGALFWSTIPSGSVAITNSTTNLLLTFTDVGPAYVRLSFNTNAVATGSLGGSGTFSLYYTAKTY